MPRITLPCPIARAIAVGLLLVLAIPCTGGETDQFMTWDLELEDSADELNRFLDEEIAAFLGKANRRARPYANIESLTRAFYLHLFQGLHASRVRSWLKHSADVDRHPENDYSDLAYQRVSVFRKPAFPFFLPMAQTIRIGDVYCGIDKIGHMFGFGRRYYQIYQRHRNAGAAHEAAIERVVRWGIRHEANLVGGLVDGIFSHADLEANYQGLRLALNLSTGPKALFFQEGEQWQYREGLDIRDYVTPNFDESFNPNHYLAWRHKRVAPVLAKEYGEDFESRRVQERFERYRRLGSSSASKRIVDAYFRENGEKPHHRCWVEERCDADT